MRDDSDDVLNFDKAEYDEQTPVTAACGLCERQLAESYYEINGQVVCPPCKENVENTQYKGSGPLRFLKALALGLPAAALGSGIYYGISALTGYEFGLVAIVIGLLVGGAVRIASNRQGGWVYQSLAIFLTYLSIASTYIPYAIQGFAEEVPIDSNSVTVSSSNENVSELESVPVDKTPNLAYSEEFDEEDAPTSGELAFLVVFFIGVTLALPFLAGFENIIGLLIIGFALYEAWKMNRKVTISIAGPFALTK